LLRGDKRSLIEKYKPYTGWREIISRAFGYLIS
jgi:hypothetical protein